MEISPTSRKGGVALSNISVNYSGVWWVRERPEIEKVERTGSWPGWQEKVERTGSWPGWQDSK